MILGELFDNKIHNTPKLDQLLVKLCALVVQGKKARPNHYGLVAACVVDTDNQIVYGINEPDETEHRVHAERVAIDRYHELYGEIPSGSIIVTTLSPCSQDMSERHGDSCTDLINQSGVKKVYAGYMDPTQDTDSAGFTLQATKHAKITELCRMFADTFLKEDMPGEPGGDPKVKKQLIPYPAGTVEVDVSDVYDWYKLGVHIPNLDKADPKDFGQGPPHTTFSFGSEQEEHEYMRQLQRLGMGMHDIDETAAWRRKAGKNKNGGLNAKGVASYRRENPGSKLQTAVTTKPSKLKPGSKAAKRRKSFCARMSGVDGPMEKPNGEPTRKALALRKWNC